MKKSKSKLPLMMQSEVMCKNPIDLKYVLGVFSNQPSTSLKNLIKNFPQIKIINDNKTNLDDIIKN